MKLLERNKKRFWYCNYSHKEKVVDEDGNYTGEIRVVYDEPVECWGSIGVPTTETLIGQYGVMQTYYRLVQLGHPIPINEQTVFFLYEEPSFAEDGTPNYNYIIRRIQPSLTDFTFQVAEVAHNG